MTPIPPAWAMAMAMRASVTVSIAEDRSGMFMRIERVTKVDVSASEGSTLDAAGTRRTSSNVRASRISMAHLIGGVFVWRFPVSRDGAKRKGKTENPAVPLAPDRRMMIVAGANRGA